MLNVSFWSEVCIFPGNRRRRLFSPLKCKPVCLAAAYGDLNHVFTFAAFPARCQTRIINLWRRPFSLDSAPCCHAARARCATSPRWWKKRRGGPRLLSGVFTRCEIGRPVWFQEAVSAPKCQQSYGRHSTAHPRLLPPLPGGWTVGTNGGASERLR